MTIACVVGLAPGTGLSDLHKLYYLKVMSTTQRVDVVVEGDTKCGMHEFEAVRPEGDHPLCSPSNDGILIQPPYSLIFGSLQNRTCTRIWVQTVSLGSDPVFRSKEMLTVRQWKGKSQWGVHNELVTRIKTALWLYCGHIEFSQHYLSKDGSL